MGRTLGVKPVFKSSLDLPLEIILAPNAVCLASYARVYAPDARMLTLTESACYSYPMGMHRHFLLKLHNIIFYENPTTVSSIFICEEMDGRTDMLKLINIFLQLFAAKAP
jgi:hypothetical protein